MIKVNVKFLQGLMAWSMAVSILFPQPGFADSNDEASEPTAAEQNNNVIAEGKFRLSQQLRKEGKLSDADKVLEESVAIIQSQWDAFTPPASDGRGGMSAEATERLQNHVVNTGFNGQICKDSLFASSPKQLNDLFLNLEDTHKKWSADGSQEKHIVLYAHGGLVTEESGLEQSNKHLDWWLGNKIYPINFVWHTGIAQTMRYRSLRKKLKDDGEDAGRGGSALVVLSPQLVERAAKKVMAPLWQEMKNNAAAAAVPLTAEIDWTKPDGIAADLPGVSLTVSRLRLYLDKYPDTKVHVVGHSAGSIFSVGILERMKQAKIPVASVTYLAPAIRVSDFREFVLPKLVDQSIGRLTIFDLPDATETSDISQIKGIGYRGSILCLVSHSMEPPGLGDNSTDVPLLGLAKFFDKSISVFSQTPLRAAIENNHGLLILSNPERADALSKATSHGGFAMEPTTMNSAARGILQCDKLACPFPEPSAPTDPQQ